MQPKKHKKSNSRSNRAVWTVFVNCAHWRGSKLAIYKTVLIIFPLNLQTITIASDVVKWSWGGLHRKIQLNKPKQVNTINTSEAWFGRLLRPSVWKRSGPYIFYQSRAPHSSRIQSTSFWMCFMRESWGLEKCLLCSYLVQVRLHIRREQMTQHITRSMVKTHLQLDT